LNFTNTRWRTAAVLKTVKLPYLSNRFTDFDEIWHGDANCPITADRPLKFRIFENSRCRHLRNGFTHLYEIWYADAKWVS